MRSTSPRVLLALTTGFLAAGCSTSLPSPPTTLTILASPGAIGTGRTSLSGSAYGGRDVVFGPNLVGMSAEVRHGIAARIDLGVSVAATVVVGTELANPPHRGIYSARGFAHVELVPRVLALQAGLGGGGSAAGGFFSPDVGLILGFENRYFVPYVHGAAFSSFPITERRLDLRLENESMGDFRTAFLSFGVRIGVGTRIPIGPGEDPNGSLMLECSATWFTGADEVEREWEDDDRHVVVGAVAYRHRFGR